MPIKEENKSRYPDNWKEIRENVLRRAGNKCEFCGVVNHSYKEKLVSDRHGGMELKQVRIVLTIAHLDNVPEHCDMDNLRALCQKCHLNYDKEYHMKNAKHTRALKAAEGMNNLFDK